MSVWNLNNQIAFDKLQDKIQSSEGPMLWHPTRQVIILYRNPVQHTVQHVVKRRLSSTWWMGHLLQLKEFCATGYWISHLVPSVSLLPIPQKRISFQAMALKEVAWPLPAAWEVKFWYFWRSCRSSTNICTAANSYPSQTVRWVQLFWQQNATLEPDLRRILDPSWILSLQITLEHLITPLLTAGLLSMGLHHHCIAAS